MNENETTQEEEISLIDLFAVLIRHRMLIILGTIIITFIAGLYLFIAPKFIKKLDNSAVKISYNVKVSAIPSSIMEKLPAGLSTPTALGVYNANRIQLLVDEFKAYPVFTSEDKELSEYEFNGFIQQVLTKKKYVAEASKLGSDFDITMEIPLTKIDTATDLVKDIITKTNAELENYYGPLINDLEKATNNSLKKGAGASTSIVTGQNLQSLADEIEIFKASHSGYLTLKEAPFVIPQAKGRTKKLIIICFAAFFIFVFIAFLMNAIENIKADPEASKVISDAWKSGKKSKK